MIINIIQWIEILNFACDKCFIVSLTSDAMFGCAVCKLQIITKYLAVNAVLLEN